MLVHGKRYYSSLTAKGRPTTRLTSGIGCNSHSSPLRDKGQWRKVSFGNRSAAGELATARLLTVSETCDLQQLNTLAYLAAAIACHRLRQPAKSLLPASEST